MEPNQLTHQATQLERTALQLITDHVGTRAQIDRIMDAAYTLRVIARQHTTAQSVGAGCKR